MLCAFLIVFLVRFSALITLILLHYHNNEIPIVILNKDLNINFLPVNKYSIKTPPPHDQFRNEKIKKPSTPYIRNKIQILNMNSKYCTYKLQKRSFTARLERFLETKQCFSIFTNQTFLKLK